MQFSFKIPCHFVCTSNCLQSYTQTMLNFHFVAVLIRFLLGIVSNSFALWTIYRKIDKSHRHFNWCRLKLAKKMANVVHILLRRKNRRQLIVITEYLWHLKNIKTSSELFLQCSFPRCERSSIKFKWHSGNSSYKIFDAYISFDLLQSSMQPNGVRVIWHTHIEPIAVSVEIHFAAGRLMNR